jgi:hypothetical protein
MGGDLTHRGEPRRATCCVVRDSLGGDRTSAFFSYFR